MTRSVGDELCEVGNFKASVNRSLYTNELMGESGEEMSRVARQVRNSASDKER